MERKKKKDSEHIKINSKETGFVSEMLAPGSTVDLALKGLVKYEINNALLYRKRRQVSDASSSEKRKRY